MIQILDAIYSLNLIIVSKVEELQSANHEIKCNLIKSKLDQGVTSASAKSYAAAVGGPSSDIAPPIVQLSERVDSLEQDTLSTIALFQGPIIAPLLDGPIDAASDNIEPFQDRFVDKINTILPNTLIPSNISACHVIGKTKKQVRVIFISKEKRDTVMRLVKSSKPDGLFINEGLTKLRSNLFYRCRCLKKNHESFLSVHVRSGTILCRLTNENRPLIVNTVGDLAKLQEALGES